MLEYSADPSAIDLMADPSSQAPRCVSAARYALVLSLLLTPAIVQASELRETPIVRAVRGARPSVVNIRGEKTVPSLGEQASGVTPGRKVNGMGTGVVIDARGYILTNFHVVDGVREINVTLADGQAHVARLAARDSETDLAVIKIDTDKPLPVIHLGTSSDLMPGESVIAVGNAYGYEHTVTRGIVSALHRAVQVSDAQFYDDLIQTDASINPGNSGGPLLNIDGDMIGVNVAVRAGAQGIGFAIPIDTAIAVAGRLLAESTQTGVWHGIRIGDACSPSAKGVKVEAVEPDSPAAAAGVQAGDIITAVAEMELVRPLDFYRAMLDRKPGEQIELATQREGASLTASLVLADEMLPLKSPTGPAWEMLGIALKPMADSEFQKKSDRYRGGLLVTGVRPGGPAAEHGVQDGDVLVGMHIWETTSLENVTYILKRADLPSLTPLKVYILRDGETLYAHLPIGIQTARRP